MFQVAQIRRRGRRLQGVEMRWLHPHGSLTTAGITPVVVGDSEQPRLKPGRTQVFCQTTVGLHEGFLREVVSQGVIAAGKVPEEPAYGGLVAADQFSERGVLVVDEHPGDQFGVGHDCGGRVVAWSFRPKSAFNVA